MNDKICRKCYIDFYTKLCIENGANPTFLNASFNAAKKINMMWCMWSNTGTAPAKHCPYKLEHLLSGRD